MSLERSFDAWEEVQRHGQELADKIAKGVTGLIPHISPPSFPWPNSQYSKLFEVELSIQSFIPRDFGIGVDKSAITGVSAIFDMWNRIGQASKLFDVELPSQGFIPRDVGITVDSSAIAGVSSIFEIGNRIGQAGAYFGACLNGMVHQFFRKLPVPFRQEENLGLSLMAGIDNQRADMSITLQEDLGLLAERFKGYGYAENDSAEDKPSEEEFFGVNLKAFKNFGRSQCANSVIPAYISIIEKRKNPPFTEGHKAWQQLKRGRYVEFNLVYDRGTTFGLKMGGRIESILVSLPLTARWEYDHQPEEGTEEWKLLDACINPKERI